MKNAAQGITLHGAIQIYANVAQFTMWLVWDYTVEHRYYVRINRHDPVIIII